MDIIVRREGETMGEVRVDPGQLRTIAGDARLTGRGVRANVDEAAGPTTEASRSLSGFRSRAALESLAAAWAEDAKGFESHMSGMAQALELCARDYEHSDHTTALNFTGLSR